MTKPRYETCEDCLAHFAQLTEERVIVASANALADVAMAGRLSPAQAIASYFEGYHVAQHPPTPARQDEARLTITVEMTRNGKRMEPHPFDPFFEDACGHGIEQGDFCSLPKKHPIHAVKP